jgi:hypothetical protein
MTSFCIYGSGVAARAPSADGAASPARRRLGNFPGFRSMNSATGMNAKLEALLHEIFRASQSAVSLLRGVRNEPMARRFGSRQRRLERKNGNSTQHPNRAWNFVVESTVRPRRARVESAYSLPRRTWRTQCIMTRSRLEIRSCVVIAEKHGEPPHDATQREVCGYPAGWRDPHSASVLQHGGLNARSCALGRERPVPSAPSIEAAVTRGRVGHRVARSEGCSRRRQ